MDISLFHTCTELEALIELRAEMLADKEHPPEPDEIAALDGEIRKYELHQPAKVTGVVAMFRKWKSIIATAKAEIERYREIVRTHEAMEARLKEYAAGVLELLPEPKKGCRKLTGADGSLLMLKGNGGIEPLQVDGWDEERRQWLAGKPVLPIELCWMEGRIRADLFELAMDLVRTQSERGTRIDDYRVQLVPDSAEIRRALNEPCSTCKGAEIAVASGDGLLCSDCNGTGKRTVPGARLLPRGVHVEIR